MRYVFPAILVLCPAMITHAAPIPKERQEAEKVVGVWKLVLDSQGGSEVDLIMELQQSGKMILRQRLPNGNLSVYEGTYTVVGKEMPYEVKQGKAVKKETLIIKKITADELVVVDPDGLKEEFVRVKKKD
jgi:uncharacterized protein (TIGR03066 family)